MGKKKRKGELMIKGEMLKDLKKWGEIA